MKECFGSVMSSGGTCRSALIAMDFLKYRRMLLETAPYLFPASSLVLPLKTAVPRLVPKLISSSFSCAGLSSNVIMTIPTKEAMAQLTTAQHPSYLTTPLLLLGFGPIMMVGQPASGTQYKEDITMIEHTGTTIVLKSAAELWAFVAENGGAITNEEIGELVRNGYNVFGGGAAAETLVVYLERVPGTIIPDIYKETEPRIVSDNEYSDALNQLSSAVAHLSHLYTLDNTLNNRFDLDGLIPMSLDEWALELYLVTNSGSYDVRYIEHLEDTAEDLFDEHA